MNCTVSTTTQILEIIKLQNQHDYFMAFIICGIIAVTIFLLIIFSIIIEIYKENKESL